MNKTIILTVFLFTVLISSPASVFGGALPPSTMVNLGPNGESPQIPIELVQLDLVSSAPIAIPLASDPGNLLGDSIDGYGFVDSQIEIKLSSLRTPGPGPKSLGIIQLTLDIPGSHGSTTITQGDPFLVDSFFDVFYDITITDIDPRPGRDIAGQSDGASIKLPDNGPVHLELLTSFPCEAQVGKPLMGCLPELANKLFVGGLPLAIPLGGDINRNGEDDKIKFSFQRLDPGRVADIPLTTTEGYFVSFDSFFDIEASVGDLSTDPPFSGRFVSFNPMIILLPAVSASTPLPGFPDNNNGQVIGGKIIPIETTSLLLAGTKTFSWMIPILLSGIGIGLFAVSIKPERS